MRFNVNQKPNIDSILHPVNALDRNKTRTTDNYKFQSTAAIIEILNKKGLELQSASVARVNKNSVDKQGFQKHCLTFSSDALKIDNDNRLTAIVTNSHSGDSSLKLNLGVFRLVCANGLVVGNNILEWTIPHRGEFFNDKVIYALDELNKNAPMVKELIVAMSLTEIDQEEELEFKKAATIERLKNVSNVVDINVNSFRARRQADTKNDLYTVYNKIQEVIIKGGLQYKTEHCEMKFIGENTPIQERTIIKNNTTRKISSITENINMNKFLWNKAESFLKIAA